MQPSLSYSMATPHRHASGARRTDALPVRVDIQNASRDPDALNEDPQRSLFPTLSPDGEMLAPSPRPFRLPRGRVGSGADLAIAERMFLKLQRGGDVREDKVARVRAALASGAYEGVYEMEFALDIVADRLLEDLI